MTVPASIERRENRPFAGFVVSIWATSSLPTADVVRVYCASTSRFVVHSGVRYHARRSSGTRWDSREIPCCTFSSTPSLTCLPVYLCVSEWVGTSSFADWYCNDVVCRPRRFLYLICRTYTIDAMMTNKITINSSRTWRIMSFEVEFAELVQLLTRGYIPKWRRLPRAALLRCSSKTKVDFRG